MEEAIEIAALHLSKKLEKAHAMHAVSPSTNEQSTATATTTTESNIADMKNCSLCRKTINEIESGRRSPIVMSPTTSAKFERRIGVSERNPTEGKLVRETMKVAIVNKTLHNWGFKYTPSANNR